MLCTTPMFCYPDWPRRLTYYIKYGLHWMRMLAKEPMEPQNPAAVFNEKCIYDKETVKSEEKTTENNNQEKENPDGGAGGGNRVYYLGKNQSPRLTEY